MNEDTTHYIPLFNTFLVVDEENDVTGNEPHNIGMSVAPQTILSSHAWQNEISVGSKQDILNYMTASICDLFMMGLSDVEQMDMLNGFKAFIADKEFDESVSKVDRVYVDKLD